MPTPDDNFGQQIDRTKAGKFFARLITIKERAVEVIKHVFRDDPVARRYYCGRDGASSIGEDWAYLFDLASLQRMMDKIKEFEGDGMIIINGVRNIEDSPGGKDTNGRPTLMLFPIKKQFSGTPEEGYQVGDNGEEHPGTGGGVITRSSTGDIELPRFFKKDQIHEILKK